jgi:NADH-quinone oxidoreductase subunit H
VWVFLFGFMWLRATLPRMRYDQFMALGWKILIPISLAWIMTVAVVRTLRAGGYDGWAVVLIAASAAVGIALIAILWKFMRHRYTRVVEVVPPPADSGAFPIPPIPTKEHADA